MKSSLKWFLIGGAVLGIGLLVRQFAGGIVTTFKGIKWAGFDGIRMKFSMFYALQNTNDISATVSSLRGKVYYGDYRLSDIEVVKPITVSPGGTEDIEVRFSVSAGTLVGEITRFFEEKSGVKNFRLKGWMSGEIGKIPFTAPVNEKFGLAE